MTLQNFAKAEIDLTLSFGTFLCRLPPPRIAALQQKRGIKVTYPDMSTGVLPKRIGTIVREHLSGVGGSLPHLTVDPYFGDFDPEDSREVVAQALIGASGELNDGTRVTLSEIDARSLIVEHFDAWPLEEKWRTATAILIACTQGFVPPTPQGEEAPPGNAEAADGARTSSST